MENKLCEIGKRNEGFTNEQRIVQPLNRLIETPELVLKAYAVYPESHPLDYHFILKEISYINKKIRDEKISPETGVGYVKIAKKRINIIRWKENNIIRPEVNNYDVVEGGNLVEQKDQKESPFCMWEAMLLAQESKFWRTYLDSNQTSENLTEYLNTKFQGKL